ncbi:MAG: transposase [Gammaproteobacteria bacterium]|nr:transposase [Gammaproteobacteria bacterium]
MAGGIYHVVLRGNACEPIFFHEKDRNQLNHMLAEGLQRYQCRLHAFCWMTNHLHAAIQVSNQPLSGLMCWLGSRYARYINRSRSRTGHLFERRHRAELVADDEYLLNLVRYIHRNPVKAGLVADPAEYPWSSHRCYLGTETLSWVTTRAVLCCFSDSTVKARRQFLQFMTAGTDWTPTEKKQAPTHEGEVLRTDELAMTCLVRPTHRELVTRLDEIVKTYCESAGINATAVTGRGRQRDAARARSQICSRALLNGTATLGELANYFGRAPEVISRGIARYSGAGSPTRND